jgi:hypothetical protein
MARLHILSGIYQGGFANTINQMCSPANIKKTAAIFRKLDKDHNYKFGDFAQQMIKDKTDWGSDQAYDRWKSDVGDIPNALREHLTDVIRTNMWSDPPLPMLLQVGDNIGPTHDVIIKVFAYKGANYIGILMLCPNPALI